VTSPTRRTFDTEVARAADARDRARRALDALERLPETHAARAHVLAKALEEVGAALDHAETLAAIDSSSDVARFASFVERMAAQALAARSPMLVRREHLERTLLGVAERCGAAPTEDALTSAVDYAIARITAEDAGFGRALSEARGEVRAMIAAAAARRPRNAAIPANARWSGNARRLVERYQAARAALFRAVALHEAERRFASRRGSGTRRVHAH